MIKLCGYLGGHYLNIGTTKVTPIIGAIGQKWMNFGIKITCRAFKKAIPLTFHCPIPRECHHPGGKPRRPFRVGRTGSFDYLQFYDLSPIFPFFFKFPQ